MEIRTKYNIGDDVYFLFGGEVKCLRVEQIDITVEEKRAYVMYRFLKVGGSLGVGFHYNIPEGKCFASKEELIRSL
jgi:hypothetical protein